jgi:hypothetical protein
VSEEDKIEVKVAALRLVYDSLLPVYHRLNSALESTATKTLSLGEPDKALLLEFCAHAITLKILFEGYFATEEEKLVLSKDEYLMLIAMAKSVETASRTTFGNLCMWPH